MHVAQVLTKEQPVTIWRWMSFFFFPPEDESWQTASLHVLRPEQSQFPFRNHHLQLLQCLVVMEHCQLGSWDAKLTLINFTLPAVESEAPWCKTMTYGLKFGCHGTHFASTAVCLSLLINQQYLTQWQWRRKTTKNLLCTLLLLFEWLFWLYISAHFFPTLLKTV